ncbi:MAG: AAA family ATPase [Candidatus Marinimicrobia bacterium]|jgi:general secretion pathway protein A|nr:AAA family ATPase [Candidatus Neomarinimicrobiota bacterium]MDD5061169.1 AAA family ATPase [Candidatus Neomarinimicrobiota bacterium]MDD5230191.1 AAA family ATPase [Candidatus Neomarinimicrobiota bacterium]MDD5540940.1 AAA family ATPase [Candidatus Neomarinimicrobiota bacterium]
MYLDYWKIKEKPFENSPDPKFLFHSKQHDEALFRLLYAIQSSKGAALLTGEYGCGKTLLMHTIISELSRGQFKIAYLTNPRWSATELVQEILYQFEINNESPSRIEMLHVLNDFLFQNVREKRHTIIIVDEAQVISDYETFEELRLLLNFQLNDRFLITLFLVGQPELNDMVQKIPQLNQRVAVRFHLKRFNPEETKAYIEYRLKVAGRNDSIFTDSAIEEIYKYSQGTPRIINNICDLSLVIGFGKHLDSLDNSVISGIIDSER